MKRSNRWIFEYEGKQLLKAVDVRFTPTRRDPEIVYEPDGSATPLPGTRFGLSFISVKTLDEKDAKEFHQQLTTQHPRHGTLAVYLINSARKIVQSYELEKVLPIGEGPDPFRRYQKNHFHRDNLRFVGDVRRVY